VYVGVDIGAARVDCVALDDELRVMERSAFESVALADLAAWAHDARVVAIDAPAQLSAQPHAGERSLAPKFRRARCAEIALGRGYGAWVPWVPGGTAPGSGWMRTGLDVYEALRRDGAELLEVYPHAGFRELAGRRRLARKQTAAGRAARTELLRAVGVSGARLEWWSHDELDAALAALVAWQRARGTAVRVTCGHDDSAIWLPAPGLPRLA
jgi:predicted nuclease with RNAse H fold